MYEYADTAQLMQEIDAALATRYRSGRWRPHAVPAPSRTRPLWPLVLQGEGTVHGGDARVSTQPDVESIRRMVRREVRKALQGEGESQ